MPSTNRRFSSGVETCLISCLALLYIAMLWLNCIGYYGGDDREYFQAARQWLTDFPPLGRTHWSLRYPIVLPLAAYQRIVGVNEWAMLLVNLVYGTGIVLTTYALVRAAFGQLAAFLACSVLATNPVFVIGVVCLFSDVPELFFAAAAFALYFYNFYLLDRPWRLASSGLGLALGLALMVRETSIVLIAIFCCVVLLRRQYRAFFDMSLFGLAPPTLAAMAYQWWMSGNPLYRLGISSKHDSIDRANLISSVASSGDFIDWNGTITVNVLLDPIILLFANHKIGLIFWALLVALLVLYAHRGSVAPSRRSLIVFLASSLLLWVLFIAFAGNILWLVARYLLVPIWISCVLIGAAASIWLDRGGRRALLTTGGLLLLLASNCFLLLLEHKEPMIVERRLAAYVQAEIGNRRIYSDPQTANNTNLLLLFDQSPAKVLAQRANEASAQSDLPRAGDIVAVSHKFLRKCRERDANATDVTCVQTLLGDSNARPRPQPAAQWAFELPKFLRMLEAIGVLKYVPYGIARRLMRPDDRMLIFEIA